MSQHDLIIVGAGPVGLALALALRDSNLNIALVDTRAHSAIAADPRVLALAYGTRLTLERLGVWHALPATAIKTIHISQQGGFGRTRLRATEHDQPALGYVLSAGALTCALRTAVDQAGITVMDNTTVTDIAPGHDRVTVKLNPTVTPASAGSHTPTLDARLVACAEGAIDARATDVVERNYDQHALIAHANALHGHQHTAFERFSANGPIALLPCEDHFAVVHVVPPAQADHLLTLSDAAYLAHLQSYLGTRVELTGIRDRLRYPLGLRYRPKPIGERTAWLGNAAQTLHPVAGQGFNLALRDAWGLAQAILQKGGDPGRAETLQAYAASRQLDRASTIHFTDSVVRLFSNDIAPLRHARGAALFALDVTPPLRHFIAKRMMFGARAWP